MFTINEHLKKPVGQWMHSSWVKKHYVEKAEVNAWFAIKTAIPRASCQDCRLQAEATNKRKIVSELRTEIIKELEL